MTIERTPMFTKRRLLWHFCLMAFTAVFLIPVAAHSQHAGGSSITIDSLSEKLRKDSSYIYRPKKLMVLLSLDMRNTFLETDQAVNTAVNLRGLKIGVTVNQRHKTGVGAYQIRNSRTHLTYVNGKPVDLEFTFRYFTIFYEYFFIHTRRWDVGLPFEVGVGKYTAENRTTGKEGVVYPYGTSIDVRLKPMRWFSLNTMGGYRFVGNNFSGVKLSNWYYSFGLSVNTRNLYEDGQYYLKKRKYKKDVAALVGTR